jgi:hypothetical protein
MNTRSEIRVGQLVINYLLRTNLHIRGQSVHYSEQRYQTRTNAILRAFKEASA